MILKKTVLIVVAHTDDETIGMGGTISKHVMDGDDVAVVSLTDGVSSRAGLTEQSTNIRQKEAEDAARVLGFRWHANLDFPDNKMDDVPLIMIVKAIEPIIETLCPEIVYTHSLSDLNIDHQIVFRAVLTACRPQPESHCKEIRCFEVQSSTDYALGLLSRPFSPNLFINIDRYWEIKQRALEAYSSEMREPPHSRSINTIKALSVVRGSQSGCPKAESFEVVRKIEI